MTQLGIGIVGGGYMGKALLGLCLKQNCVHGSKWSVRRPKHRPKNTEPLTASHARRPIGGRL